MGQEQAWRDLPRQRTERLFEGVAPHNRSEERTPGHLSKDGGNMCRALCQTSERNTDPPLKTHSLGLRPSSCPVIGCRAQQVGRSLGAKGHDVRAAPGGEQLGRAPREGRGAFLTFPVCGLGRSAHGSHSKRAGRVRHWFAPLRACCPPPVVPSLRALVSFRF